MRLCFGWAVHNFTNYICSSNQKKKLQRSSKGGKNSYRWIPFIFASKNSKNPLDPPQTLRYLIQNTGKLTYWRLANHPKHPDFHYRSSVRKRKGSRAIGRGQYLPETNSFILENGWLEDTCFLLGALLPGRAQYVSFREFLVKSVVKSKMSTRTDSWSCDFSFNIYGDSMRFPLKTPVPLIDIFGGGGDTCFYVHGQETQSLHNIGVDICLAMFNPGIANKFTSKTLDVDKTNMWKLYKYNIYIYTHPNIYGFLT